MADDIDAYAAHHEESARLKDADDATCSAEMHRKQAAYAREYRRFPRGDEWPKFEAWCRSQWEA